MHTTRIELAPQQSDEHQEVVAIHLGGHPAGEAVVRYEAATACIAAHVDLARVAAGPAGLDDLHLDLAEELLAFICDRGAAAQEQTGAITYTLGDQATLRRLPSRAEVGLGYPNSW